MNNTLQKTDKHKKLLAIVHCGRKQRGLNDEEYRAVVRSVSLGRHDSAGNLTIRQLSELAKLLDTRGGEVRAAGMATPKQQSYIRSLWRSASNQGDSSSLNRWLENHWGVSSLEFVSRSDASSIIAVLKKGLA